MCHVLIIEDAAMIAEMLRDLLEEHGATSFAFAVSQSEAVTSAIAKRPGFITSDVTLVEGTGPLAVAEIQAKLGPVPVIFITATPGGCRPCATDAPIFLKPFNRAEIARVFRELAPVAG